MNESDDDPTFEESAPEQIPAPPSEDEINAAIQQADIDAGGTGDLATIFDTSTNVCATFCFYATGRIGEDDVYFSTPICAPTMERVLDIARRVYEYLRERYPIATYRQC